jgi:hypothetical protein
MSCTSLTIPVAGTARHRIERPGVAPSASFKLGVPPIHIPVRQYQSPKMYLVELSI